MNLFELIGELFVENRLLRRKVEELEAGQEEQRTGVPEAPQTEENDA